LFTARRLRASSFGEAQDDPQALEGSRGPQALFWNGLMHKGSGVVAVLLVSLALSACDATGQSSPTAAEGTGAGRAGGGEGRAAGGGRGRGESAPVPVVTARVEAKPVPVSIPAVGTAEALSSVQIRSQVTGQLGTVHFSEGQEVRKGQPLFTLDARPFEVALQQAQAVLARDTATAENARSQQARYADLFKRGLIPRDQFETQSASTTSLQATLAADQAAVDTAKLNVQYTKILAPISGRTGVLGVHVGDLVRANDTAPMVVINQLSPIYVTFSVPGRFLGDIQRFQARKPLVVRARSGSGAAPGPSAAASAQPEPADGADAPASAANVIDTGTVSFIDNTVDATTGTIKLKGIFPNASHGLWPGLFVQVGLDLTTDAGALVVPAAAVQSSQTGQYVYVAKPDHTVEMRTVTVQRQQGNEMIIAQGLKAGEEVVTDGHLRLTPGARITTGGGSRGDGAEGGRRGEPGRSNGPSQGR
jgi:multidrug efflux system membrane fusion protein